MAISECPSCTGTAKAQGATEYLVLLGAVLLIGLAVVALLGFFPGTAKDIGVTQSQIYWQGVAKPLRILETASVQDMVSPNGCCLSLNGNGYRLLVENAETDSITLTDIKVNSQSKSYCERGGQITNALFVGQAEKKTVDVLNYCGSGPGGPGAGLCNPGDAVQIEIFFHYNTRYISNLTQNGSKKLAFICT